MVGHQGDACRLPVRQRVQRQGLDPATRARTAAGRCCHEAQRWQRQRAATKRSTRDGETFQRSASIRFVVRHADTLPGISMECANLYDPNVRHARGSHLVVTVLSRSKVLVEWRRRFSIRPRCHSAVVFASSRQA